MLVRVFVNIAAICYAQPGAVEKNDQQEESPQAILPNSTDNWFTSNFDIQLFGVLDDEPTGDVCGSFKWDTIVAEDNLSEQLAFAGTVGGSVNGSDIIQFSVNHPIHNAYRWCYLTLSPKKDADTLYSSEEIPCIEIIPNEMVCSDSRALTAFKTKKGELGIYFKAVESGVNGVVLHLKRLKEPIIYTEPFYNQWTRETQWMRRGLLQFDGSKKFRFATMFKLSTNEHPLYINILMDESESTV
ncbi:hypothetical protein PAPHI01_2075 [Pancytospora philotis]|nr:hypothetical protein PAPHI01_2075 [Pancytospora philotis]